MCMFVCLNSHLNSLLQSRPDSWLADGYKEINILWLHKAAYHSTQRKTFFLQPLGGLQEPSPDTNQCSFAPVSANWSTNLSTDRRRRSEELWSSGSPGLRRTATGRSSMLWFKRYVQKDQSLMDAHTHTHTDGNEWMMMLMLHPQYGDSTHTLIEYLGPYKGLFLPGYKEPLFKDPLPSTL